jgi:ABC-type nitrate/sulfonate/bicarbonate transport system permease component
MSRFTIDFLRTIPPIALVSLVLLILGATQRMALVLVVFGSFGPLLLPTVYGVQHVEPQTREVARSYRLRRRDVLLRIVIPSALPFMATGLRVAATISLLLTIGAELIGGAPGLGYEISISQQNNHVTEMYCYIVVCAALGSLINLAMIEIERRVIRWSPNQR